jgi:phosphatidylserine/phosphatidylglycerophosphate/cardiolipin synthase-like enzyme
VKEGFMSIQDFQRYLRQSLDDRRLSRSEQKALSAVLGDEEIPPSQLGAYRSAAFKMAKEQMRRDITPDAVLDWLEDVVKVLIPRGANETARSDACFSPGETCLKRIRTLFRQTRQSADICVFTVTDDRITEQILAAHRRGVRVRLITDNDKSFDRGSDVEMLERNGIEVRIDRTEHHMHHKFALFDRQSLLTGSYNWTRSACQHNEENLIVTDDQVLLREFAAEFERLWEQFG